jgi:Uma2 family endonuclease
MGRIITEMEKLQELIEAPLSRDELAIRYRDLCEDPLFANVPGKIELDLWGRMVMSPPGVYHGLIQGRLCQLLAALGGETFGVVPIATPMGLFAPDVAWASAKFMSLHGRENPLMTAPEICIEVVSPSNSVKEMQEKREAYFAAGASEVWIVYPKSKRCEFHGGQGLLERSSFVVDLSGLFS